MPADLPANERFVHPQPSCYVAYTNGTQVPFMIQEEPSQVSLGYINWGINSGAQTSIHSIDFDILSAYQNQFHTNRQFIRLEQSFDEQYPNFQNLLREEPLYSLKEKLRLSADAILNYKPEIISLQLTNEGSIFYTFVKDDYKIFLQHFLLENFDGADEAICSIFKAGISELNYAGSLSDILLELNSIFLKSRTFLPALT